MARRAPEPPPGFDELPVEEQIAYLQSLWDRIAAAPDCVPEPPWHKDVLQERLAKHRQDPEGALSWEEVRERAARHLRKPAE